MGKNNDSTVTTLENLIPQDRKFLLDDEEKVGQIKFTAAEKRELLKLISSPGWGIVKGVYAKQRAVQIAVAGLNMSQSADELFFYKGKAAEVDYFIKTIEKEAKTLQEEENKKNNPNPKVS